MIYHIPCVGSDPKSGWFNTRNELQMFSLWNTLFHQENDKRCWNKAQREQDSQRKCQTHGNLLPVSFKITIINVNCFSLIDLCKISIIQIDLLIHDFSRWILHWMAHDCNSILELVFGLRQRWAHHDVIDGI